MDQRVRCVIMRGGTSKAICFAAADLPQDPAVRDEVILHAFGSPDVRQLDGLGGADPLTSKLAIIAPSRRDHVDVDYTFGQVGISTPTINYQLNCGNTAAAVALFAVQEGFVTAVEGSTPVRIRCTNSNKLIAADVPTQGGTPLTEGRFRISGLRRAGAEIRLKFIDPAGGITGSLLPTGAALNEVQLHDGTRVRLSLVDCGNLYAIVPASTWALTGTELPQQIEANALLRRQVEEIREAVCRDLLPAHHSSRVKVAIVGGPANYRTLDGEMVEAASVDVVARIINQERVHKSFAVTGAISLGAAARIPGTTINELCRGVAGSSELIRIGHPQGVIEPSINATDSAGGTVVHAVQIGRTARRLMEGFVFVPTLATGT
jgi:2-methylaconitate cis-trans-isomerase PrpF